MKTFTSVTLLISAVPLLLWGQTRVDLRTQSKSPDLSAMTGTKPLQVGSALPTACNLGQLFYNTSASTGANVYGCTAANVWTPMSSGTAGGGIGALQIQVDKALIGARSNLNFQSSPGLTYTASDDGSSINVTPSPQSSLFETRDLAQGGIDHYCVSFSGNTSAYTCTLAHTLATYSDGMQIVWKPDVNCVGGITTTLNVDANGPQPIYQNNGLSNPAASSCTAGSQVLLAYAASLHNNQGGWRILNAGSSTAALISHLIAYPFDGGGAALLPGKTMFVPDVPFSCSITGWSLVVDQGSATADVWVSPDSTVTPTVANSITGSASPSISGQTRIRSSNLTGWTTAITNHSVIGLNLKAVSGATQVTFGVECDQ